MSETPAAESQQAQRRMPLRLRLLTSALIGLVVFAISCEVAYQSYCGSAIRAPQPETLRDLRSAADAIQAYRRKTGALPQTLQPFALSPDLRAENGVPADHWGRPLHYSTDGDSHRIISYGYDGKPGGIGLDSDLSTDDLAGGAAQQLRLLRRIRRTFRQFATDAGRVYALGPEFRGFGWGMFLGCLLSGAVAFALGFVSVHGLVWRRRDVDAAAMGFLAVAVGALWVALVVILLDVPSGH